ncbi:hypothetical protein MMC24_007286 [Lignoscripta atroalba]|nr:hypothetical protein [Lignoscripta atroalba]
MIEILSFFDGEYVLRDENNVVIARDNSLLQPGKYYIDSPYPFIVNNETTLVRAMSSSNTGPRTNAFRNAVRERDGRCVITGEVALGALHVDWVGFEAAHIFPLAYEQHWKNKNFARWITISPIAGGTIKIVQNGMLLDRTVTKLLYFGYDTKRIAGKHLDSRFLDDPQRPPE